MSFLQSSCVGLPHPGAVVLGALGKSSPDFPGGPEGGGWVHLPIGKTTIAKGDDIWSFNHGPVIMGLIMGYAGF